MNMTVLLMTRITDEKGRVLLRNRYESRVLMRQQFGNGATYSYSYDWAPNRYYPDKVVVTFPDRQSTRYSSTTTVTLNSLTGFAFFSKERRYCNVTDP